MALIPASLTAMLSSSNIIKSIPVTTGSSNSCLAVSKASAVYPITTVCLGFTIAATPICTNFYSNMLSFCIIWIATGTETCVLTRMSTSAQNILIYLSMALISVQSRVIRSAAKSLVSVDPSLSCSSLVASSSSWCLRTVLSWSKAWSQILSKITFCWGYEAGRISLIFCRNVDLT